MGAWQRGGRAGRWGMREGEGPQGHLRAGLWELSAPFCSGALAGDDGFCFWMCWLQDACVTCG